MEGQLDSNKKLYNCIGVFMGCDPEFFFTTKKGEVIGSEKVLNTPMINTSGARFMMDGVQVELNPQPHNCREGLGGEISLAFKALKTHMEKIGDVRASFTTVVEIDKKELDTLSDRAKVLGCAPSLNAYGHAPTVTIDAEKYLKRSAGGHIHLGINTSSYPYMKAVLPRLVPLLDIFLGNTCVLLDRDPNQVERRKVYGRAGEHRLPAHGLEYRTLSNFWLRSYQLTSFVMGVARQAANLLGHTANFAAHPATFRTTAYANYAWDPEAEILSLVDLKKVEEAINTNDLALAQETWEVVKKFLVAHAGNPMSGHIPRTFPQFEAFAKRIQTKGIEKVFPQDPVEHWCKHNANGRASGWESYIASF